MADAFGTTTHGTPLGRITRLWRYPVKSLQAEALASVELGPDGLAGDRRRALLVATPDHARSSKPYRGKEHNLLHTTASVATAVRLGEQRGIELTVAEGGPFFDAGAVSIVVDAWLAQAQRLVGIALEPLRFRPNIFVETTADFAFTEEDLVGARLYAGSACLCVRAPIKRCVTINYDIATGTPSPCILTDLASRRRSTLGVYADVVTSGTLVAGDMLARATAS